MKTIFDIMFIWLFASISVFGQTIGIVTNNLNIQNSHYSVNPARLAEGKLGVLPEF